MRSKYFAIIPARGGSKGIKGKNLVNLGGKPLIQYTIEAAMKSKLVDFSLVSTDDKNVEALAIDLGLPTPFMRPSHLAQDDSSLVDVVVHALEWYNSEYRCMPMNILLLQPTSPFRTSEDIDSAIHQYERQNASSLVSVVEPMQHPNDMVYFENERLERLSVKPADIVNMGRQKYRKFWFVDGGIYLLSVEKFLGTRKFMDESSIIYIMPRDHGIDIDDPYTLELAQQMINYKARKPE